MCCFTTSTHLTQARYVVSLIMSHVFYRMFTPTTKFVNVKTRDSQQTVGQSGG